MVKRVWVLPLLVVGLLAAPSFAQDSVANTKSGLPGDALSPYDVNEQVNTYIVDMDPFLTSWGTRFGIAPLMKSGKTNSQYFNNQVSSSGISAFLKEDVFFAYPVYSLWKGKGYGINDNVALNKPGVPVNVSGTGAITNQFAACMSEFGTTDNDASGNYITTAIVNYWPGQPGRLYVGRVNSATNGPTDLLNQAQYGIGAVDEQGNVYFRSDDYGVDPGGPTGNNIFRVLSLDRDPALVNNLTAAGGNDAAATEWLVMSSPDTHGVPCCVPASLVGRAMYIGTNFNDQYAYEVSPGAVVYTGAYLTGASTASRGNVAFSKSKVFSGTIGTAMMFAHDNAATTRRILMWGLLGDGSVSGNLGIDLPNNITDNEDGNVFPPTPDTIGPFNYHASQTPFRGGNGQVAMCTDKNGKILVAVPIQAASSVDPTNPFGGIAVLRFDPANPGGTQEWTTATYIDSGLVGKGILDGSSGSWIGQQVALFQVSTTLNGPSMSAPMFDSAGNIWFLAAVALQKPSGFLDYDIALMRAVYDPDNFLFELEKVVELGQVFHGRNAYTNYMITYLDIADSNSVSSGTCWSHNIMQEAWDGMDPATLDNADPRTLGGIVFKAGITYDVNYDEDFDYENPPDEDYNVLMYIGYPGDNQKQWDSPNPDVRSLKGKKVGTGGSSQAPL
jgi:hypothetical protein